MESCRMNTFPPLAHFLLQTQHLENLAGCNGFLPLWLCIFGRVEEGCFLCIKNVSAQNNSCCCSVSQPYPTLCDPMDCSTPDFPILHHLPELAQTHVHWVSDAIQSSHLLLSPSPITFYLSQHRDLSQWLGASLQVAKVNGASASSSVLSMNIQGWFPLGLTGLISLLPKGLSRVFSNTTVLNCELQIVIHILNCIYMNKYSLVNRSLHHET